MTDNEKTTATEMPSEKEAYCPLCGKVKKFVLVKGEYYCISCGYKLPKEA